MKATPEEICYDNAKDFIHILEEIYSYSWDTEPDYNKIVFMFEKI